MVKYWTYITLMQNRKLPLGYLFNDFLTQVFSPKTVLSKYVATKAYLSGCKKYLFSTYVEVVCWQVPNWLTYDFPPAVKAKVNRLWGGGEWHGQAQKWCVFLP